MDNNEPKRSSAGRGSIMLKIMKMKEAEEARAAAPAIDERPETAIPQASQAGQSTSAGSKSLDTPALTPQMSTSSVTGAGRGRATLLGLMKAMQSAEAQPSKPSMPVSQGRASIISFAKGISSVGGATEPPEPRTARPTGTCAEVVSKLSELSIQSSKSDHDISTQGYESYVPSSRKGTSGREIQLSANYINLQLDPGKGLFLYEVKYSPDIDSRPLRRKLLNQHLAALGRTKIFDGVQLYLPQRLENEKISFESIHPMDGTTVTLTLIYKKEQTMAENVPFFNILMNRVMRALSLVRIGQHNFNPKGVVSVPQHRLEIWPGYVTAVSVYDSGLKLCIDARHRVMRTETVRDLIIELHKRPDSRDAVGRELIGTSVLTRYNNKTYRIDDIDWAKSPAYEFKRNDESISLIDYYKTHWNVQILDHKQPLLVHRAKDKLPTGGTVEQLILLVPELCYIAGLTDSIRSDFRVMKDLDAVTKVSPNSRRTIIREFVQEAQKNSVANEVLSEWGLRFDTDVVSFTGRVLDPEVIHFGQNKSVTPPAHKPADWSAAACRNPVLRTPNLHRWCIFYVNKDTRYSRDFVEMLKKVSTTMGITVSDPQMIALRDDRTETYIRELRNNIHDSINLVVVVFPSNRTDRYSAVKRICCVEKPVASQAIMSRTIGRADKLKSITEKIALQINCKLGGALWSLTIPMDNCMICGIDVYHAGTGQSKGSVAGFVASLDRALTTWHSKICLQGPHQELVDLLQTCLVSALQAYRKRNARYPDRIIIYRDGVGDGQIDTVARYEVKQILATFKNKDPNYKPKLSVIIVQKRINCRVFLGSQRNLENPPPGTIVDSCITKHNLHDFYLVSQNVRQGTVSPTRYIVVYDSANMKVDHIQRLSYKLCHLYYNWPGTIKVPAPCQYAHKLVYLVGQNIQREPHECLSNTLFYL